MYHLINKFSKRYIAIAYKFYNDKDWSSLKELVDISLKLYEDNCYKKSHLDEFYSMLQLKNILNEKFI